MSKTYKCKFCEKEFNHNSSLCRHQNTCKNNKQIIQEVIPQIIPQINEIQVLEPVINNNDKLEKLYEMIIKQNEEINLLKSIIEKQNDKIENQHDKIEKLNDKIEKLNDKIEKQNDKIEKQNDKIEKQNDMIINLQNNIIQNQIINTQQINNNQQIINNQEIKSDRQSFSVKNYLQEINNNTENIIDWFQNNCNPIEKDVFKFSKKNINYNDIYSDIFIDNLKKIKNKPIQLSDERRKHYYYKNNDKWIDSNDNEEDNINLFKQILCKLRSKCSLKLQEMKKSNNYEKNSIPYDNAMIGIMSMKYDNEDINDFISKIIKECKINKH